MCSLGGPLALLAIELPDAVGGRALDSTGLVVAAGAALFSAPLLIWWRFSGEIASSGGLYAFAEAALGRRWALLQGALWIISYVLYVAFTTTQVIYDLLPVPFPGVHGSQGSIELALPVALTLLIAFVERPLLWGLVALAAVQVAGTLVLGATLIGYSAPFSSFTVGDHPGSVARGIGNASLLFVCASLPLFLGAEIAGGGRVLRRIVTGSVVVVAALLVFAAFALAAFADSQIASLELPGYIAAQIAQGTTFAKWISAVAIASVLGLVIAEFVALTRLLHAMTGVTTRGAALAVGAVSVAADALSLANPDEIYGKMITPSLVALYLSQLIVFAGYAVFARRRGRLGWLDGAAVVTSCCLMIFALEVVISQQTLV